MKLWSKGYELNKEIERYTVGDDPDLDRVLVSYDCVASMAHARVLERAGVLTLAPGGHGCAATRSQRPRPDKAQRGQP